MLGSRTTESQRGQVSTCLIALSVIPRMSCVKYLPGSRARLVLVLLIW